MELISPKKVMISYTLSSLLILAIVGLISMPSLIGPSIAGSFTILKLMLQLATVLIANAILHWFFYYGDSEASPMSKGVISAVILGVLNFAISVFALNIYDIYTDSIVELASGISSNVLGYGSGGFLAAVISVTDVDKWSLFKLF